MPRFLFLLFLLGVALAAKDVTTLTNRQLRRVLHDNNAECTGCVERQHLVDRAVEVLQRRSDLVTSQLTQVQHSVKEQFMAHRHVTTEYNVGPNVECHSPFDNETVYCYVRTAVA